MENKVDCKNCGVKILQETYNENNGMCVPCKKGRKNNQNQKPYGKLDKILQFLFIFLLLLILVGIIFSIAYKTDSISFIITPIIIFFIIMLASKLDIIPSPRVTKIKKCKACGEIVPNSSKEGDYCPHCGAYWNSEKINY